MKPVKMEVSHPSGVTSTECDNLVAVAFVGEDTGWRAITYKVFQGIPSRRLLLHAAKAILDLLAEDQSDAFGKAAARALEQVHRKSPLTPR